MHSPKFQTYSPKKSKQRFEALHFGKGLNSGGATYCTLSKFICLHLQKIKSKRIFISGLLFGLWKAKYIFISCSLVPLFRLFGLLNLKEGKHSGNSGKHTGKRIHRNS